MELFIRNLDSHITQDQLSHQLASKLDTLEIRVYDIQKRRGKTFAYLTIANTLKAQKLLARAVKNPPLFCSPSGRQAQFATSRRPPDARLLRVLQKEENTSDVQQAWHNFATANSEASDNKTASGELRLLSIECGRWEIADVSNKFVPYYLSPAGGSITCKGRDIIVKIDLADIARTELIFENFSIQSLSWSWKDRSRALIVTSVLAPKIYEVDDSNNFLAEALARLMITPKNADKTKRYRECGLPASDSIVTGTCLVYRLVFPQDESDLEKRVQRMISRPLVIEAKPKFLSYSPILAIVDQITELENQIATRRWPFPLRFQIQALWANAVLAPNEIQNMLPTVDSVRAHAGDLVLIKILQRLGLQLPFPDAKTDHQHGGWKNAVTQMLQQEDQLRESEIVNRPKRDEVSVHRVTITPTGTYLYGPEEIAANRVLRQYQTHQDHFLRVLFADEDEERVVFDAEVSNEKVFQGKFLSILRNGLDIAGEHFDFLGFSHSSLRSQTCWFMRPFLHEGSMLTAKSLIDHLGDFSGFRCPAKCAARIGQAFSETTSAIRIDVSTVRTLDDIENKGHTFTDGCGTMSESTWRLLKGSSPPEKQPTSYQIRYKGVKGMLTLDSRLKGYQVQLRESMVKFSGSPSNDIEICGANVRPLPFKLNRQIIKILEDLNIADHVFEHLQEQAIQYLRFSTRSASTAINFLSLHLSESSGGLPTLLRSLQKIGIQPTEDDFIRDVLGALIQVQLREIKYRSRIPVPNARTLYGISDETGWLEEGQVFVTFDSWDTEASVHLNGRVAVTRMPALHPGDIQVAQAVEPPEHSCLWDLRNCVVFSQKGERDLPSMLSGGDLDGDLYNIIFDENLIPDHTVSPAAYPKVDPVDIGRVVTSDDMAEFFVNFMQNDQLGRIATVHQVFADDPDGKGSLSNHCLLLAELHSTAVDFSKTGRPVDITKIPKSPRYRPDFMAPSASTKVERGIKRSADSKVLDRDQGYRYYESDRILGKLYRAADENAFFKELEDDQLSIYNIEATNTVMKDILDWIICRTHPDSFLPYLELAAKVRHFYEWNLLEIMSQYAVHRNDQLTEKEVFIGTILGKSGKGSQYQREQSEGMKSRFRRDLRDIKAWMRAQTSDDREKFLNLCAACVHLSAQNESSDTGLRSFGWFAASICVPALARDDEEVGV